MKLFKNLILLATFSFISDLCKAFNPDYYKHSVEETVRKTSPLLTKILKTLISNDVQNQEDLDDHYASISEMNIPDVFTGKLKPNKNNWFQILPISIRTKHVSLKTVTGCVIASIGERLIRRVETEAVDHTGEFKQRMEWAEEKLGALIRFLKRAICTLELVMQNQGNSSHYAIFMDDYFQVSKYLYKLAISAYKQISNNGKYGEVVCSLGQIQFKDCMGDVSGILKQLKCLSLCQQQNHCRNKITKLRKTLRRVRRLFINSLFRLKRKGQTLQ